MSLTIKTILHLLLFLWPFVTFYNPPLRRQIVWYFRTFAKDKTKRMMSFYWYVSNVFSSPVYFVLHRHKKLSRKTISISENIWDEGSMNVFLFRFLLISKSAIKYKKSWSRTREMCLYSFFSPPGLVYPSLHPHKPTIIKPSFKSFTFFLLLLLHGI